MKNTLAVIVATLAVSGSAILASPAAALTDPVGTTFTYQGRLMQGSEPVTDTVNLSFRLYNAAAGGSQVAPEIEELGFGDFSEGGEFTVQLDFGGGPFNGMERWLEVRVNGAPLSPRQPITSTPYSIHTRGIHVNDSQWVGLGTVSQSASNVPAIRGRNTNTNDKGIGVDGRASFIGLLGIGLPSDEGPQSGTRYGVYGQAAVDGVSNYGVLGHTFGTGGMNYGVYAAASDTDAFANDGVYGFGGAGATHYWAGYFSGKVNVTGTLTKGGGSFRIDHPLDPENKYLYHSFKAPHDRGLYLHPEAYGLPREFGVDWRHSPEAMEQQRGAAKE